MFVILGAYVKGNIVKAYEIQNLETGASTTAIPATVHQLAIKHKILNVMTRKINGKIYMMGTNGFDLKKMPTKQVSSDFMKNRSIR